MKDTAASAAARQKRGGPARPTRTVSAAVDIDAPPMAVWAVLTDLSGYPEWNPHFREGAGEVAAGNRLTLKVFDPNRAPVTIHPLVLAAEPGVEWRSLGGIPGRLGRLIFSGEHRFALTRAGDGTRLVQSEAFRGILVPFLGKAITAAQTSFGQQNEALKKHVEARHADR